MALLHRTYDDRGSGPVLVLTATGQDDVARLVQLLNGDTPDGDQRRLAAEVVTAIRAHAGGRAVLDLIATTGGHGLLTEDVISTAPSPAPAPSGPGAGRIGESCWVYAIAQWRRGEIIDARVHQGLRVRYVSRVSDGKTRERWFSRSAVLDGTLAPPVTTFCAPCNVRWTGKPGQTEEQLRAPHNSRFHVSSKDSR